MHSPIELRQQIRESKIIIEYGSIFISSSILAACTNSNQPKPKHSGLDKVTFATNWVVQAKHGGLYPAIRVASSVRLSAVRLISPSKPHAEVLRLIASGIHKNHALDVTIKMGDSQVASGTQLLMGDAVDFFVGTGMNAINAIAQDIPKITVTSYFLLVNVSVIQH